MIARLTGTIAQVEANTLILDVQGVGYKVSVPVTALDEIGKVDAKATLFIHMHIRPEEISLYGFARPEQQKAFEVLIGVSGIGPKVALSILSAMDVQTLAEAVASEDTRTLVRVPGLGLKTAQRMILEIKDKMSSLAFERRVDQIAAKSRRPSADMVLDDVIEGLVGLGYNRNDARRAADRAIKDVDDKANSSAILKSALNFLTGAK